MTPEISYTIKNYSKKVYHNNLVLNSFFKSYKPEVGKSTESNIHPPMYSCIHGTIITNTRNIKNNPTIEYTICGSTDITFDIKLLISISIIATKSPKCLTTSSLVVDSIIKSVKKESLL